jgi:hypothetical protein
VIFVRRFAPLLLILSGCRSPTEVTLILRTDVPCSELTGVTIAMHGDDAPRTESRSCDASGALGTIVLVPSGSKTDALEIEIAAGRGVEPTSCATSFGPNCIVVRRRLRYLPHVPLTVPIDLRSECAGVACDPGATCVAGLCHLADVDPGACATSSGCGENALGPPTARSPPPPPPPPPPTGGPYYVASTDIHVVAGTSTMTLAIPAGVVAGDFLMFGAYTDLSASAVSVPAGWVSQPSVTSTVHNWRGWGGSRRATGTSDPALVLSLTGVGSEGASGVLAAYRGVSSQPSGSSSFLLVNDATQAKTYTALSLPARASDLLVILFMSDALAGSATSWSAPAGTTQRAANANLLLVDAPATPPATPSYTASFLLGSGAVAEGVLTP